MKRLENKVCLITGAAQGIGKSTVELFLREGAFVVITDINDEAGENLALKLGPRSFFYHLDVTRPEQWKYVMEQIKLQFGKLDVLVNNAGITGLPAGLVSIEVLEKNHAVNSEGVFLGCQLGIQYMKYNKSASIINVSSHSGIVDAPETSSKTSVRHHTKSVALDCAERGYPIRCNSVHSSAIFTSLWEPFLGEGDERLLNLKKMVSEIPLKRFGRPEEVAAAILFLATDECLFMTGTEIVIDGGLHGRTS